jgi:hypothetical protein
MTEAISYRFQPGILEAQPAMTEEEFAEIYGGIRDRFYEPVRRTNSQDTEEDSERAAPVRVLESTPASQPAPESQRPTTQTAKPTESPAKVPEAERMLDQRPDTEGSSDWSE